MCTLITDIERKVFINKNQLIQGIVFAFGQTKLLLDMKMQVGWNGMKPRNEITKS